MLIPALIFWYIEDGWTYLDSLYFAFVALMTIGFGDYVAGKTRVIEKTLSGTIHMSIFDCCKQSLIQLYHPSIHPSIQNHTFLAQK